MTAKKSNVIWRKPVQKRTSAKQDSDLLIAGTIIDRIRRHEVLLSINQNYGKIWDRNLTSVILFRKKKNG